MATKYYQVRKHIDETYEARAGQPSPATTKIKAK